MKKKREGYHLPYLAAWRRKKFKSQAQLAEISTVSESTIKYLERPISPHPANLSTIAKLADALGIEPDILVTVNPFPEEAADTAAAHEEEAAAATNKAG